MTTLFNRLGKPADASELSKWSAQYDRTSLAAGDNRGLTIAALMDATLTAPATTQATALINRAKAVATYLIQYRGNNKYAAKAIWDVADDLTVGMAAAVSNGTDEFNRNAITQLYVALFGRAPDASGLQFWLNATAGNKLDAIASGLIDSAEGRGASLFPTADANGVVLTTAQYNNQLVTRVYMNMLGRAPSASELDNWSAQLAANPGAGKGKVVISLINAVADYVGTDPASAASRCLSV